MQIECKAKRFASDLESFTLLRALACVSRSHTCRARGVFCEVHAPAKDDCTFFAPAGANSARLFQPKRHDEWFPCASISGLPLDREFDWEVKQRQIGDYD
jgi:hypothetical protein